MLRCVAVTAGRLEASGVVGRLGGGDQNACMRSVSRVSLFRAKITRWARPASSLAPCHRLPLFAPTIHVARPLCLFDCLLLCLFVWLSGCLYQQTEILKRRQNILFLLVRGAQVILRNWAYRLTLSLISEAVPGVLQAWKVNFLLHRILVIS